MEKHPTKASNRIELLDIYRGFAILGIFVVNIVIMNSTFLNQDEFAKQFTSTIDQVAEKILQLFFYTKFFPIFSLLFGLGISMQAVKLLEKKKLKSFFVRRMVILFFIGVFHIVFIWSGDVLNLYAIIGLFTTLLIKNSNRLILGLAVIFLFFPFYDQFFEFLYGLLHYNPSSFLEGYTGETINQIIRHGSYWEGVQLRLLEYASNIPILFGFLAPIAISMFLVGLYLGKNKIYLSLDSFIEKIKKPVLLIGLITNIYRIIFLFYIVKHELFTSDTFRDIFIKLMVLSDVAMGLFYLWILGWLYFNTKWKKVLSPLKYAGRMALTNYILQSVIGLFLFSSMGLKLYETFSPMETLSLAIFIFILQVLLSKVWLSHFQYGPLEWIWRCLTYKKVLPIKRQRI